MHSTNLLSCLAAWLESVEDHALRFSVEQRLDTRQSTAYPTIHRDPSAPSYYTACQAKSGSAGLANRIADQVDVMHATLGTSQAETNAPRHHAGCRGVGSPPLEHPSCALQI
jgi:hypothetical protein